MIIRDITVKKTLISGLFGLIALGAGIAQVGAVEISKPSGVVELFTSQGCYSCPPADKIIGKMAKKKDILALGWHVDYWDYLGWKDTFASRSNTERQYRYARSLQERQVYTPQAVINGRAHAVGSDESKIRNAISTFDSVGQGLTASIDVSVKDDNLMIDIASTKASRRKTLWLVYYNNAEKVDVERGENRGKLITYHNVVQDIQMLGMVKNNGLNVELPISEMKRQGYDSCAVILQSMDRQGNPGPIVGASIITDL